MKSLKSFESESRACRQEVTPTDEASQKSLLRFATCRSQGCILFKG